MTKPYRLEPDAQSESGFNLTYEGYACSAFEQNWFQLLTTGRKQDLLAPRSRLAPLNSDHARRSVRRPIFGLHGPSVNGITISAGRLNLCADCADPALL